MSIATLQVPARLAGRVHRSLMSLYAVSADALHHEAQAYAAGADMVEEVLRRRAELAALDELVSRVGWLLHDAGLEVTVVADGRLLHDALYGVALDVLDDVDAGCRGYLTEEVSIADVRARIDDLVGLVELTASLTDVSAR